MRTVRSKRATAIAQQFVTSTAALAGLLETLSDEVWDRPVPTDGRTVGIVAKHLADSPPVVIGIARSVSAGGRLPSWEAIHEWNAQMAKTNAGCDPQGTIRALREAAVASVESIEKFTDDELDVTTVNDEGLTRSVAELLHVLLVGHTLQHTGDIEKAVIKRTESERNESRHKATDA
jgi:hypothetical protein